MSEKLEVALADRKAPALSEQQLSHLTDLAKRVESHFGNARDVEWAFAEHELYVLQARPIVVPSTRNRRGSRHDRPVDRRKIVWSNANVGEALPGVATPFTWSVLSQFSDLGFRRAFGAMGCTVPRDAELVGDFRGRIYINLTEFSAIMSQIPWIHPSTLVRLGGGQYASELDEVVAERSSTGFLLRLPQTVSRYARENFRLEARVDEFETYFSDERTRINGIDPRLLEPSGLDRMLGDVEHLLDETGSITLTAYANLLSAVLAMIGLLRTFARSQGSGFYRELLSGLQDVSSARPGFALWQIAQLARDEPELAECIRTAGIVLLAFQDVVMWVAPNWQESSFGWLLYLLPLTAVTLAFPLLLSRIWRTSPLPASPLRAQLEALTRRVGVPTRDFKIWQTDRQLLNAAVSGLLPAVRYVFLTDAL